MSWSNSDTIFLVAMLVLAFGLWYFIRLDKKSKEKRMKEIRKNRIVIFSTLTKDEFEDLKGVLDFGEVSDQELSLIKEDDEKIYVSDQVKEKNKRKEDC